MAIKIRCDECRKKISIDEAFIDGVCRCPYCKAIVPVIGDGMPPAEPVERAETPGEILQTPESAESTHHEPEQHVPTATPVKLQGILTIAMLVLVLLMIAGGVYMFIVYMNQDERDSAGKAADTGQIGNGEVVTLPNPFGVRPDTGMVAGVEVDSPVVYIIDGGSSMREMFDYAAGIARASVLSLRSDQKFSLIVPVSVGQKIMPGGYHVGGKSGDAPVKEFLLSLPGPFGATDLEGVIRTVISQKPGTIILLARKPVDEAKSLGEQAKAADVRVVTISLDADSDVGESFAELASGSDGESLEFSFSDLQRLQQKADLLE